MKPSQNERFNLFVGLAILNSTSFSALAAQSDQPPRLNVEATFHDMIKRAV
jgi:hypothetical protein